MGLNMKERQVVTMEYTGRYKNASKKEKKAQQDEYGKMTGYHMKSVVIMLCENATMSPN